MHRFTQLTQMTYRSILRDRLLHVLLVLAVVTFLMVPAFSLFSMRQVQELSITLSLSAISFILMMLATLLGASSIWRDVEKKYTSSVLGLPLSRSDYLLAKFAGITFFLTVCTVLLGALALVVIALSSAQYGSSLEVRWENIITAIVFDYLKYILLTAVAIFFSSLSTSFFFPFLTTIAVYLCGSASQEVFEYVSGEYGNNISPATLIAIKGIYYLLPNFSAFNLKVQAIYALPLSVGSLAFTLVYFVVYTSLILWISVWSFARRELI